VYEFAFVAPEGSLPSDQDLERTVREGLRGTAMPPLAAPPRDVHAVAQYVKTFAARWATASAGTPIDVPEDPWKGAEGAARERGERLYHVTALCASCHPNYAPRARIAELTLTIKHVAIVAFRDDMYGPARRAPDPNDPDDDGLGGPDFAKEELRTMRGAGELAALPQGEREADATADLWRVIGAGVGASGMRGWHFVEPYVDTSTGESWEGDKDVWALAHYVRSLAALRGTPGAEKLRADLNAQPPWTPPAPPAR
jgi:mono/diheme cytochrome c family protein